MPDLFIVQHAVLKKLAPIGKVLPALPNALILKLRRNDPFVCSAFQQ
jgi:hypothetical protein